MDPKNQTEKTIKLMRFVHYLVFGMFLVSVGLITFSAKFRIYGALWIIFMRILQIANRGECPLTIAEHNARKKLGEHQPPRFMKGVLKKYFNINAPDAFLDGVLIITFAISVVVVINYLLTKI